MTREEIQSLFLQQIDCSQVVAEQFAEELKVDKELLRKVSACFGGGMQCGETCGAVTGALMVIGLKYGHFKEDDMDQKVIMMKKVAEFKEKFAENPIYRYHFELDQLVKDGLLEVDDDWIYLTDRGIDLANIVWEKFV